MICLGGRQNIWEGIAVKTRIPYLLGAYLIMRLLCVAEHGNGCVLVCFAEDGLKLNS